MMAFANPQSDSSPIKLLAVSGDVGGARAVMAFLHYCESRQMDFTIVEHGTLNTESPENWRRINLDINDKSAIENSLRAGQFNLILFSTSVNDMVPLAIARAGRELRIPLVSIIDNRTSYLRRFVDEDGEAILPDLCSVMDKYSYADAVNDGIPENILLIAGQPALASLAGEYKKFTVNSRDQLRLDNDLEPGKKLVVFISEPVAMDQGEDNSSPTYRGYTEKTVLSELLQQLAPYSDAIQLGVLPHPRQDREEVNQQWLREKGNLQGRVLNLRQGREGVFMADAVCGMASILLYEAWLFGKPTLSLQPGLIDNNLNHMASCKDCYCINKSEQVSEVISKWINEALSGTENPLRTKELNLHESASQIIYEAMRNRLKPDGAVIEKSIKK